MRWIPSRLTLTHDNDTMAQNVEIKARVADVARTRQLARDLCASDGVEIVQRDTFFESATGRLKLREFTDGTGELISYHRPDEPGPSRSDYRLYRTASPGELRETLAMTLGCRGEVRKTRHLFMAGRTRIHLDEVEGLGHFLELEVVLEPGDDAGAGEKEAERLMTRLGVGKEGLVRGAYRDMLDARP